MRTIQIDESLLSVGSTAANGLIRSLLRLQDAGYTLVSSGGVLEVLQQVLENDNIIIKSKEGSADYVFSAERGSIAQQTDALLKQARTAEKQRTTKETDIRVAVNLDDASATEIKTGIGFFDHMLEQISRHGNIGLQIHVTGDLHIDEHHTVEDTGITLGETLLAALGDKRGIKRYGFLLPMDDCIAEAAVDLGGRAYLNYKVKFSREKIGEFPVELGEEFFRGIAQGMKANVYIRAKGKNEHHKMESIFKAFAKALNEACRFDERSAGVLPTTKGLL